jgi:putative transposase
LAPRGLAAKDGELTDFVRWLSHTHVMRWHSHYGTAGSGHLYQGRFKSFPVQTDDHFYSVVRYVERNARRAQLVERADAWRWSSLWRRNHGTPAEQALLHRWPLPEPAGWARIVNRAQSEAELNALRQSIRRGAPYGAAQWQARTATRLNLEWTLRPRGRPLKRER